MLSPAECARWVAAIDARMDAAAADPGLSLSGGLCFAERDAGLAEAVRLRAFGGAPGVLVGERWFCTRYGGDPRSGATTHLGNHTDGTCALGGGLRSNATVLIYLNGGFAPGVASTTLMSGPPPDGAPVRSVAPEAGKALVLRQDAWHRGDEVPEGAAKYLLRGDAFVPPARLSAA